MGIGNSPVLTVCSQTILCKSVPSTFPVAGVPTGMHTTYQEKHSRNFDEIPTKGEFRRKRFKRGPCYA